MTRQGPLSLKPFLITLLCEACEEKKRGLTMDSLETIAEEHSMRLDDIVSTLISLVNDGSWCYVDQSGESLEIEAGLMDSKQRLDKEAIAKLTGSWQPVISGE